jgi:hypothetical protein
MENTQSHSKSFIFLTAIIFWLFIIIKIIYFLLPFVLRFLKKFFYISNYLYILYKLFSVLIYFSDKNMYISKFVVLVLRFLKSLFNFYGFRNCYGITKINKKTESSKSKQRKKKLKNSDSSECEDEISTYEKKNTSKNCNRTSKVDSRTIRHRQVRSNEHNRIIYKNNDPKRTAKLYSKFWSMFYKINMFQNHEIDETKLIYDNKRKLFIKTEFISEGFFLYNRNMRKRFIEKHQTFSLGYDDVLNV